MIGPAPLSATRRSVFPMGSAVAARDRSQARHYRNGVLGMTGLPGSGNSTVAQAAVALPFQPGIGATVLDGDTLRMRLSSGCGCLTEHRRETVALPALARRAASAD